jgi:hypothetical protein
MYDPFLVRSERDGVEELEFSKEGFFTFRHEYTPKKAAPSEDDSSSDEDDEHGHLGSASLGPRAQDAPGTPDVKQESAAASVRVQARHTERGPSDNASDDVLSFVVNPDEFVGSDDSDEEAATGKSSGGEAGPDTARS